MGFFHRSLATADCVCGPFPCLLHPFLTMCAVMREMDAMIGVVPVLVDFFSRIKNRCSVHAYLDIELCHVHVFPKT